MADIVERLRGLAPLHWEAKEAADEITALRAEVEDLGARLHHVHRLWANNEHALRAEVEKLKAALRLRADAEEHCLAAVNYVGRYNSGERIEEARGRVRNAFTDFEEAEREALGDTP